MTPAATSLRTIDPAGQAWILTYEPTFNRMSDTAGIETVQVTRRRRTAGLPHAAADTCAHEPASERTLVAGTWARTGLPGAVATASYDAASEQLALGGATMTFDSNGNLVTQLDGGGATTYTWNARDQLAGFSGPSVNATFGYDGLGRRRTKAINAVRTDVLYDGITQVQEGTLPTTPIANVLTGLAFDEYFLRSDTSGAWHFLSDALGSTLALTDGTGAVSTEYTYEPFGATTTSGNPSDNTMRFTGREDDGTGLYYYRARYYSPEHQRFLSPDPILCSDTRALPQRSIKHDPQSVNRFAYVSNRPLGLRDPLGLFGLSPECAYYSQRCGEVISPVSKLYNCGAAPLVCEGMPRGGKWDCFRKCLQDHDHNVCVPTWGRKDETGLGALYCSELRGHAVCLNECHVLW